MYPITMTCSQLVWPSISFEKDVDISYLIREYCNFTSRVLVVNVP